MPVESARVTRHFSQRIWSAFQPRGSLLPRVECQSVHGRPYWLARPNRVRVSARNLAVSDPDRISQELPEPLRRGIRYTLPELAEIAIRFGHWANLLHPE